MYFCGIISEAVTHLSVQAADGFFCVGRGNRVAVRGAQEMSAFLGVTGSNAPWKSLEKVMSKVNLKKRKVESRAEHKGSSEEGGRKVESRRCVR